MVDATTRLLASFETHDVDAIRSALAAGADACSPIRGKEPIVWLLGEYMRSDRLADCLRLLLEHGARLAEPGLTSVLLNDGDGLNGQTPLFHTVNSLFNRSEPILQLLLNAGARADIKLAGLVWGKGYDWETTFFDVTPISYAQMGLMPQMHRKEIDIYANVSRLLAATGRHVPILGNVPNRYLRPK